MDGITFDNAPYLTCIALEKFMCRDQWLINTLIFLEFNLSAAFNKSYRKPKTYPVLAVCKAFLGVILCDSSQSAIFSLISFQLLTSSPDIFSLFLINRKRA